MYTVVSKRLALGGQVIFVLTGNYYKLNLFVYCFICLQNQRNELGHRSIV